MSSSFPHQRFVLTHRVSQSLRSNCCQNILYKAIFEHFKYLGSIATLLLTSKSFQNSSFGANFIVNFVVDDDTAQLLESVLSPSSCLPMQFAPSLDIKLWILSCEKKRRSISNFVVELVNTKYLHSSLRSLTLHSLLKEDVSCFFGSSANSSWPHLQHLSLFNCELNDTVLEIITKNALQLRTVDFSNNTAVTDVGVEKVAKLSRITSLNLAACAEITDAGVESVSKLSGITFLNLSGCKTISDAGLEHVVKIVGLTSLNLSKCGMITDVGIERISNLVGLTSLNLSWCNKITDAGFEHLSTLVDITFLNLSGCLNVVDAGLERISTLAGITSLNLGSCRNITDVGLAYVCKLTGITTLNLDSCPTITDAGLEHVSKLIHITQLDLSCCSSFTDVGIEHLSKLSGITVLYLRCCLQITFEAKKKFENALPNCYIVG